MEAEILANLQNPTRLEQLYHSDKSAFKRAFMSLHPELKNDTLASFWDARLRYNKDEISWFSRNDLVVFFILAALAGLAAKLPAILGLNDEHFYPRNIGFIVFPFLSAYFVYKNKLSASTAFFAGVAILVGIIYINMLPISKNSDTLILSCVHMIPFLWSVLGFSYIGHHRNDVQKRLGFLSFNGELIVMTTIIVIAGGIVTAVTIGLFSLIGLQIEKFYFNYIVAIGLPAAPILGTFLTRANPQLVGKVSPVIARIFSPVVLVMLVTYLGAMIYMGKDPYNDREFLIVFNALLIGVLAIISFSVAERSRSENSRIETLILLMLCLVTTLVNGIALSAIVFRISEFGITPNRAAVAGSNVLILIHLIIIAVRLMKVYANKSQTPTLENAISAYLPVYSAWAVVVTFLFPLIFGFR